MGIWMFPLKPKDENLILSKQRKKRKGKDEGFDTVTNKGNKHPKIPSNGLLIGLFVCEVCLMHLDLQCHIHEASFQEKHMGSSSMSKEFSTA
jgi:hypothetical protein